MKIKMLRTLGRTPVDIRNGVEERLEAEVYDVDEEEGHTLVAQNLAEVVTETPAPRGRPAAHAPHGPALPGKPEEKK